MRQPTLALAMICIAASAAAETDFTALTDTERAAFGFEIRALLLDEPQIVARALAPRTAAQDEMRQHAEDDLSLLEKLAPDVLGGKDIAIFIRADCPDCDLAIGDLIALSDVYGVTFIQHDLDTPAAARLADALGIDIAPSYVMPRMLLRGRMPDVVLRKYLTQD